MSSNAFARSRPRVRHQRVPKTPSYAHPRFLQLVKELVRIDEIKRKSMKNESDDGTPNSDIKKHACTSDGCTLDNTLEVTNTMSAQQIIAQLNNPQRHNHNYLARQQQTQSQTNTECCPGLNGLNYSSCPIGPNTSNGYRALEMNQSTSALHDSYYRQNNNSDNNQQIGSHNMHHQGYAAHHQRHYSYPSNQQDTFTHLVGGIQQPQQQDYRSPNKCSSSSSATNEFGYTKSGLHQNAQQGSNNIETDVRQDENRSKRKRSGTEASNLKKCPTSSSPPACSKRIKSSPEPQRPLSPSFTKCPICLLDCMDRDPSFTNTCFHLFCFVCIENWSKSKATCPLCRTKFSKIIYKIRSESCFEEKIASPLRRDDDDARFTYEQLSAHSMIQSRVSHAEEARLLFDNLRNTDVLMPHLVFTNQIDPRQVDSIHSFNPMTSNANFGSNVPHSSFSATNYSQVGSNYIALIPSNSRLQATSTGPAITSAYPTNTSLTNISSDTSNRIPRLSRSSRYVHSRNYDLAGIDTSARGSRSSVSNMVPAGQTLESRQHHHTLQHPNHHQHHSHHHNQPQHRSTVTTIELGSARQNHHQHIHIPYPIPPRHYTNPNLYARRPYTNPPIEQHILDDLYTQIPEM